MPYSSARVSRSFSLSLSEFHHATSAFMVSTCFDHPSVPRAGCDVIEPRAPFHWCMEAYSEDLRKKILEAVDRGMPKSEAAKTFGVSRSSIKRYAAARREGKPLAPKKHPGSKPKLDQRARKLLEADVD